MNEEYAPIKEQRRQWCEKYADWKKVLKIIDKTTKK